MTALQSSIDRTMSMLTSMSDGQLIDYIHAVDLPEVTSLIERILADRHSIGFRAHPAALRAHLDPKYRRWRYIDLLSRSFADAFHGIDPKQIWNLASQYGKTGSLMNGVVWALDADPTNRMMYVTYDANKAVKDAGDTRDFCEAHADQLSFRLKRNRRARGMWETEQGGGLYATGVGGGIIGYPADTLLLDDLLKGWQAAHSKGQRELVWDIYKSQCRMRMQSFLSPIIACGTRWHELDHFRRLVENEDEQGDQWKIVRLPTVAEAPDPTSTDPILRLADPLDREPGELLEPERFEEREVRARFSALGSYLAAAMEQQRPAAEEGTEIKRSWFHVDETMPQHFDSALTSWDMKLKDKETDDYNVGQVWFRTGTDFWLMDQIRGKWGQAVTRVAVALLAVRWPDVKRHVIESAGFGPEVIQSLKEKSPKYVVSDEVASLLGMNEDERVLVQALIRRGLPGVVGNTVKGSKSVRMRAEAPLVEAGNVHLPAHATFTPPFLDECAAFPNGANDDQVDAFSQALSKLSRSSGRVQRPPKRQLVTPAPADIAQPIARPTRRRRAVRVIGPRRPRSPYG